MRQIKWLQRILPLRNTLKSRTILASLGLLVAVTAGLVYTLSPCTFRDCDRDSYDPTLSFLDYCEDNGRQHDTAWQTVQVLLKAARTNDCEQAWKNLLGINALYLDHKGIQNLAPLGHMEHLIFLNLRKNVIKDLRPLAGLKNLASLKLEHNKVSDLQPLAGLTQLQSLDLSENPVQDIRALSALRQLQVLRLDQTEVDDISSLEGLMKLETYDYFRGLSLTHTKLERTGFVGLKACQKSAGISPALRQLCSRVAQK